MTVRSYHSAAAFGQALEQRLRTSTGSGPGLSRARQLLIFDRLLARISEDFRAAVMLLRLTGSPAGLLQRLQQAARIDLDDFLTFQVASDPRNPDIDAARYAGHRYRVLSSTPLAHKLYVQLFGSSVNPVTQERG